MGDVIFYPQLLYTEIRSLVRRLDSPIESLIGNMNIMSIRFLLSSFNLSEETLQKILHKYFKQQKPIMVQYFPILNKSVRLTNCRTIELSNHRYAPLSIQTCIIIYTCHHYDRISKYKQCTRKRTVVYNRHANFFMGKIYVMCTRYYVLRWKVLLHPRRVFPLLNNCR